MLPSNKKTPTLKEIAKDYKIPSEQHGTLRLMVENVSEMAEAGGDHDCLRIALRSKQAEIKALRAALDCVTEKLHSDSLALLLPLLLCVKNIEIKPDMPFQLPDDTINEYMILANTLQNSIDPIRQAIGEEGVEHTMQKLAAVTRRGQLKREQQYFCAHEILSFWKNQLKRPIHESNNRESAQAFLGDILALVGFDMTESQLQRLIREVKTPDSKN